MERTEEERNAIAAEIRAVAASVKKGGLPLNGSRYLLPDVEGFFSDAEGVALGRLCKGANVLEVGSWKGRSTVFAALGGASRIVAVDTWEGDHYTGRGNFWPEFRANVGRYCAADLVVPVVARWQVAMTFLAFDKFDVLHYDADHDTIPTANALRVFVDNCGLSSFVCCHDVNYENVARVVREVAEDSRRDVFVVDRLAVLVPRSEHFRVVAARSWLTGNGCAR